MIALRQKNKIILEVSTEELAIITDGLVNTAVEHDKILAEMLAFGLTIIKLEDVKQMLDTLKEKRKPHMAPEHHKFLTTTCDMLLTIKAFVDHK